MRMVRIEVRLYAALRRYRPQPDQENGFSLQVPDGTSLNDLLDSLEVPRQEAKILFVNNRNQSNDYVLQNGDRVGIFPQVAGG